jgi:urease accessory protein
MLHLVAQALPSPDSAKPEIALRADRFTLAKRLWRGRADDGTEFGFELAVPLKHGDTIFESEAARYVVRQEEEAVVVVSLDLAPRRPPASAGRSATSTSNSPAETTRLIAADEPAVRQLLERLKVTYHATRAIFRPGRFARGALPVHELGPSHQHGPLTSPARTFSPEALLRRLIRNNRTIRTWLCGLLQTGDSLYPTGSYAHSFGLEGWCRKGSCATVRRCATSCFFPHSLASAH